MPKHTYRIEYKPEEAGFSFPTEWKTLYPYQDVQKTWAEGWLAHHRDAAGPRLSLRLVRSDGKIIDSVPGMAEVSIGMVAGWPSWQQYTRAAATALVKAGQIAERGGPGDAAAKLQAHALALMTLLQEDQ